MLYIQPELDSLNSLTERSLISCKEDTDKLFIIAHKIVTNEYMNNNKLLCRENYEKATEHLCGNEICLNQATEEQFNIILNEALKLLYEVEENIN